MIGKSASRTDRGVRVCINLRVGNYLRVGNDSNECARVEMQVVASMRLRRLMECGLCAASSPQKSGLCSWFGLRPPSRAPLAGWIVVGVGEFMGWTEVFGDVTEVHADAGPG